MHWYTTCIGQGGPPDAGCCTGDAYRHTSTRTTRTPSRSCGQNQPSRFSKRLVVLARRSATTALNHHCMQDTTLDSVNTLRNRDFGHGAAFALRPEEVEFTYTVCTAGIVLLAR